MITNLKYFGWWSTEDLLLIVTWKLFCGPQFLGIWVVEFGAGKFSVRQSPPHKLFLLGHTGPCTPELFADQPVVTRNVSMTTWKMTKTQQPWKMNEEIAPEKNAI